jgi:hypothetical protein
MMRKLRIGIVDLVSQGPTKALYARIMNANLVGIMPQVVATWCEQQGHEVKLVCYTGFEDLEKELPENPDMVFIGAFTETAQVAYALSAFLQARGAVTAIGGPHARCYPQDARLYFDYVLGLTDKTVITSVLEECSRHRPQGLCLSAARQPSELPGVRERWKFIEQTLRKVPFVKVVQMLGSTGCPYSCDFCIDSVQTYQPFAFDIITRDLQFLRTKFKRPLVGWHDPNFGVLFDRTMEAIEKAAPDGGMDFAAESSLSLLSEPRLKRLKKNGFKALLPGVESWFGLGNKSKAGGIFGLDKVKLVAEQVNMVMRYVPYVQTNFVMGLDSDKGPEPFELTKKFIDLAPGAFPGYSLLTAFGQAAPVNLEYQRANRVLGFPFHFLDNHHAMNVRPLNYTWPDFYRNLVGLSEYSFSAGSIFNRFVENHGAAPRLLNLVRAVSSEGFGRQKYYRGILDKLETDNRFRDYFEQQTAALPPFYTELMKKDLGWLWDWLPKGAVLHDPEAYLKETTRAQPRQEKELQCR